jgi:uncharacterized membrane protein
MVIINSQLVGVLLLVSFAPFATETLPPREDLIYGGLAGIAGAFGLAALYQGLALGRMGIVAPVAAVASAFVSVGVGLLREGMPPTLQLIGFAVAIFAVWSLSHGDGDASAGVLELALAVAGGIGLGLLYVFLDLASTQSVLWPLISARVCSIAVLSVWVVARRQWAVPDRNQLLLIVLVAIFNVGGMVFFSLATQAGRLDVAAVLSSLYPATTVLLARFFLKERLASSQRLGVYAALIALVLIAF